MDAYQGKGGAAQLYFVAKVHELMSLILEVKDKKMGLRDADIPLVLVVTDYINENYTRNIYQKDLVKITNVSATKLKRVFKQFTGKTISEYITAKRMDRAMELLASSPVCIEEMAGMVGFETPTGFATAFKKYTGEAPRQFRAKMTFQLNKNPTQNFQDAEKPSLMPIW